MKRCPQCWKWRGTETFVGARGKPVNQCSVCRGRYKGWAKKTQAEKDAVERKGVPRTGTLKASLFLDSKNRKLGGIPASITSRGTCPTTCSFYEHGCFAEYHVLAHHWRTVGAKGDDWKKFCADVAALPKGQLWRHNVAGDLPGNGVEIDTESLHELVTANRGRRGFGFTHYRYTSGPDVAALLRNQAAIHHANRNGFTINISTDSLEEADRVARFQKLGDLVPVAVVVPSDAPISLRTPAGRRVTICPAETEAKLTCVECQLCANPKRKAIVGFRAHGQFKAHVDQLVQLRRTA